MIGIETTRARFAEDDRFQVFVFVVLFPQFLIFDHFPLFGSAPSAPPPFGEALVFRWF